MNKKKRILWFIGIPFVILLLMTIWFVANINIYGTFTIRFESKNNDSLNTAYVYAYTPTGREVIIPFENGTAYTNGFYKRVLVVLPCNEQINFLKIEHDQILKSYAVESECLGGEKKFILPADIIVNKSFRNKLSVFTEWFFSVKIVQDILFIFIILFIFAMSYLIFKHNKAKAKLESVSFGKRFIRGTGVFFSGLIFWIIVLFIIIEIGLRIFGSYYTTKHSLPIKTDNDSTLTVLCLGDSYTYGIGAANDKSYPVQLADIIKERENIAVRVINAGVCAGNTTQMLEEIQDLLTTYHPDVVVMLFGMANSWNYYGYSFGDSFIYKIRTYKLFVRIMQNLEYKRNGFEMFQRVNDFSDQLFKKALNSLLVSNDTFEISYDVGRYFLSKREWRKAIENFSRASSLNPLNDSVRDALYVCTEKMDYDFYYNQNRKTLIQNTLVGETLKFLDSLIKIYPQATDLKVIRYRYHAIKGDTVTARKMIGELCVKFPDEAVFYFDLDKVMTKSELDSYFIPTSENNFKSTGYTIARGFYYLKKGDPQLAEGCFSNVLEINQNEYLALTGMFILEMLKSKDRVNDIRNGKEDTLKKILFKKYSLIYDSCWVNDQKRSLDKVEFYLKNINNSNQQEVIENDKRDSVFLFYCDYLIKHQREILHKDFFLVHVKKRTINIKDQDVFGWIERDINTISDICSKQGYPVLCMNYPIIPPPNSEEISYWATHVGEIWKNIAGVKDLPFINQDSLFSVNGYNKSDLFEPAFTGSEHCNEKGYELMALNIYEWLKKNDYFVKK